MAAGQVDLWYEVGGVQIREVKFIAGNDGRLP